MEKMPKGVSVLEMGTSWGEAPVGALEGGCTIVTWAAGCAAGFTEEAGAFEELPEVRL